MSCGCSPGMSPSCKPGAPEWFERVQKSNIAGACPTSWLAQCDAAFQATPVEIAAGATGNLEWDSQGVNFNVFQPVGAVFSVTAKGGNSAVSTGTLTQTVREEDLAKLIELTEFKYSGTDYLENNTGMALNLVDGTHRALGVYALGPIEKNSNKITAVLKNIADASLSLPFSLRVRATIFGFAIRGGVSVVNTRG